ncbi:mitochondrial carrier [Pholiota conissans]|uniref:Mitochondrial carrier n=1 Tax=Pholiota conissans TaxID=109636 RepID=A0A9P5Z7J1_9AGAR|nr:mitochondrial carrier [Pholiota conissans]
MTVAETPEGDERQPLLSSRMTDSEGNVHERFLDPRDPDAAAVPPAKDEDLDVRSYVVYGVLTIAGIVGLSFLIKGFIDAGDTHFDLGKAFKSALGGGLSGAAAMVLQVLTLMPLRTVMNYQYRYGTSTAQATRTLYADGGWTRYYQGLTAALVQGPISRFGDTAANAGIFALLDSNPYMKTLPSWFKTVFSSSAAAAFRMILTPIDTIKTTLQTQGKPGVAILKARVKRYGIGTMWYGALATAAVTFVGNYPWFATYNQLEDTLPKGHTPFQELCRRAFIGFVASVVSDTLSNSLRVIKTYRQVNETRIGYAAAARAVVAVDGLKGLFGRGLKTRILANGLQGLMFSVLWRFFLDLWNGNTKPKDG